MFCPYRHPDLYPPVKPIPAAGVLVACAVLAEQWDERRSAAILDWFKFQFWRFVFVQQVVGKELQTFLDYPPMQKGASFNLDAAKRNWRKRWLRRRQPKAPVSNKKRCGPESLRGCSFIRQRRIGRGEPKYRQN
jgi:hypothetical protein